MTETSARPGGFAANPLGMPIGCQTYPVRALIEKDFIGTIRELANSGYQAIELCSPVGYADTGFAGLAEYRASELRSMLADAGVVCESCHFSMTELRENHDDRIAWAKELGLTQMIVPTLDGPLHPSMDDVKRAAEEYNRIAGHSASAG